MAEAIIRWAAIAGMTTVTEKVYRHQLRPVLLKGAVAMDRIFERIGLEGRVRG